MGMLLTFSPRAKQRVPRPVVADRGPAKIVLFTGVRYERGTTPATTAPGGKLTRRRKG